MMNTEVMEDAVMETTTKSPRRRSKLRTLGAALLPVTFVATLFASMGCAAVYSDIRANGDGSYTMTYTKQGFFRVYGEVLYCVPQGPDQLTCESVDRL